jgi:hypothetical protein
MDEKITQIKAALKIYEQSHPNITNLWREYIDIKVSNLEKALIQCDKAVNLMTTMKDITNENIITLHFIALLNNESE